MVSNIINELASDPLFYPLAAIFAVIFIARLAGGSR
jgi:hypothetical protein